jgi:hypothetical protein
MNADLTFAELCEMVAALMRATKDGSAERVIIRALEPADG